MVNNSISPADVQVAIEIKCKEEAASKNKKPRMVLWWLPSLLM